MKNAEFAVGSRIRVTDRDSCYYRYRGRISSEELIAENHVGWWCVLVDGRGAEVTALLDDDKITNVQKKFIDIEHIRESDELIGKDAEGNDVVRRGNTSAFEPGDRIQITEKIDGANASVCWNADDGKLEVFSRTNLLDGVDGLRGFKQMVETKLDPADFSGYPNLVVFGEWCVGHTVRYDKNWYNVWRVYDIWDKNTRNYLRQDDVRAFCEARGLEYIHVLYEGPFISWEHCRSFMNENTYGNAQEGIVVKNQTKLDRDDIRAPKYLKIVNDSFKESAKVREKKEIDPETRKEMDRAKELIASVVTEARVSKQIMKLVDDGVLPKDLTPKCMGLVMKNLPKLIWNDILNEEKEVVLAAGGYASKFCSGATADLARKIVLGK